MAENKESPSSNSNFNFIKSNRGGQILMHNGYKFYKKRANSSGDTVWRCVQAPRCFGCVHLNEHQTSVIKETVHVCEQINEADTQVLIEIDKCVSKAKTPTGIHTA